MAEEHLALRLRVHGRVQGVWYRAWSVEQAESLGLDGWVRNRRDGTVELVVSGSAAAVREMVARCRRGPSAARVERVIEEPVDDEVRPGFRALPTA
jgi:acylphosphatase